MIRGERSRYKEEEKWERKERRGIEGSCSASVEGGGAEESQGMGGL